MFIPHLGLSYWWVVILIAFPLLAMAIAPWKEAYHPRANSGNHRMILKMFGPHLRLSYWWVEVLIAFLLLVVAIAPWEEAYHPRVDCGNHKVWEWQPPFLFRPFELTWTPFMGSSAMSIMLFTLGLAYPPITPPWSFLKLLNIPQNCTPIRIEWSWFKLPKIS